MERNNYLIILVFISLIPLTSHGFITKQMLMESQTPNPNPNPNTLSSQVKRVTVSILSGLLTGFVAALAVASIITLFVHYINTAPILKGPVVFSPKIDPKTLRHALENENEVIGCSPNGSYSKACLDNALNITVKRLKPFEIENKKKRKLQEELQVIGGLRHRHLMSLKAYAYVNVNVNGGGDLRLVYEYIPTGSLEDAMNKVRNKQLLMGWDVRLGIAVGVIKALSFLHFQCNPRVLHLNLKPSNVLLDADFEPKLTDLALSNLFPFFYSSPVSNGYSPPEASLHSRYTDKSDVFSFGVMLGVLLTGRDPLDPFFGEAANGGSLGRWLQHLQQAGEAWQALDKSLLGQETEEDEMLMAVRIALVCMSESPEDRPSSDELVPMLSRLHSF